MNGVVCVCGRAPVKSQKRLPKSPSRAHWLFWSEIVKLHNQQINKNWGVFTPHIYDLLFL